MFDDIFFQRAVHLALEDTSQFNDVQMVDVVPPPPELVPESMDVAGMKSKNISNECVLRPLLFSGPSCSTASSSRNQTDELIFNVHFNSAVHQISISNLKTISKISVARSSMTN